jgi:hypothetical protein
MNQFFKLMILLVLIRHVGIAQKYSTISPILEKKLSIDGFCPCKTTLTQLKDLDENLKLIKIDEWDSCNNDKGEDSRYVNNEGYVSEKYPNIIFQKDKDNDFISKLRLTNKFIGKLPDGTEINLNKLLAKDVLKLYPNFDTWKSRGCTNHWNLTNDTLSFFVRIDENKLPRYPVDQKYYSEKPIEGIEIVYSCYDLIISANDIQNDPIYFLDKEKVTLYELREINPNDISTVTVYKDQNAINLIGPTGKNGVIYIVTKKFARLTHWTYFKQKSTDYSSLVPDLKTENLVIYILNGKIIKKDVEAELSKITDDNLLDLKFIDKKALKKEFKIKNKLGFSISTK